MEAAFFDCLRSSYCFGNLSRFEGYVLFLRIVWKIYVFLMWVQCASVHVDAIIKIWHIFHIYLVCIFC